MRAHHNDDDDKEEEEEEPSNSVEMTIDMHFQEIVSQMVNDEEAEMTIDCYYASPSFNNTKKKNSFRSILTNIKGRKRSNSRKLKKLKVRYDNNDDEYDNDEDDGNTILNSYCDDDDDDISHIILDDGRKFYTRDPRQRKDGCIDVTTSLFSSCSAESLLDQLADRWDHGENLPIPLLYVHPI